MANLGMRRFTQLGAVSFIVFASWAARAQPAPAPSETATPPTPPPAATPATSAPPTEPQTGPTVTPPPPAGGEPAAHGEGHGHGHGHGQHGHGEHQEERRRPFFGALGYASVGLMTGGFSAMSTTFSQGNLFGSGFDAAPTGLTFGGGGGGLYNRFWLGGKGFGLFVDTPNSTRGTSKLSGAGGGGELGYAAIANDDWLVIPFFGMGYFGYSLAVTNKTTGPLPVYVGEGIPSGGETKYTAGFFTGEIGIRATRFLFSGDGGFTVGAEIGYTSSLQRAAWESSTGTSSPESAELRGGYFRLLIGGGGFSFHGKHGEHAPANAGE